MLSKLFARMSVGDREQPRNYRANPKGNDVPALESILLFALINLALYVLPISAMVYGRQAQASRPPRGAFVDHHWRGAIHVLRLPFVTERIAVYWRAHQVAGWSRKPVTRETLPKTIVVSRDAGLAKGWSEQDRSKKLTAGTSTDNGTSTSGCLVQIVHRNANCARHRTRLSLQVHVFRSRCRRPRTDRTAPRALPGRRFSLTLAADQRARCVKGSVMELRWSKNAGGELIAYWESAVFDVPAFPPLLGRGIFVRSSLWPTEYAHCLSAKIVLNAVAGAK